MRHHCLALLALVGLAALVAGGCQRPSYTREAAGPGSTPAASASAVPFEAPHEPLRSAKVVVASDALWAGHSASRTVTKLALPSGQRQWQQRVDCEPATLARYQGRIYLACVDTGDLLVIDERTGDVLQRRWIGNGPFGVVAASGRVYVTLSHEDTLAVFDARSLQEVARVSAGRQPRGIALGGKRLYVVRLFDASTAVFDARSLRPEGEILMGLQAALAESITLHPSQPRAYIPHERLNVTNLTRKFDTTVSPVVSALDTDALVPVRREALALDSVDTPVSMPAAVALSADGSLLYVANAASDDISVVDLRTGVGAGHIVVGENPQDLAFSPDGKRLYVLNAISGDVSVIDAEAQLVVAALPLAEDPRPADIHLGERLFRTSRPETVARDNWIACASCHLDAGIDGQTWLGTEGGPRNTATLRGIRGTEPLHWSADRANVQAFQATFTGLMGGKGLSEAELNALAAYLNSLAPLPSPVRQPDRSLTKDAVKGAEVFRRAGCATCHGPSGGLFTDRKLHDVGTGDPFYASPAGAGKVPETKGPMFDTPSLRELWLTAPYLHDGRAQVMSEVLITFNAGNRHGSTSNLTEADIQALEKFLMSLPLTPGELGSLFGEGAARAPGY